MRTLDPVAFAETLVMRHGFDMANDCAWRWQEAYGGAGSEQAAFWEHVVTALRHHARHLTARPNSKARKRRIRERRRRRKQAMQEARA